MYHRESIPATHCGHIQITTGVQNAAGKESKRAYVCKTFSIEDDQLAIEVRRVMAVLCANEYFNHVYEKSILEARPKELLALADKESADSRGKYEAWRPSSKKISFEELVATLEFLKNNL